MRVVSSGDPGDLVIMPDIRDDMFWPGGPTLAHLLGTLIVRAGSCRKPQSQAALCDDFTCTKSSEAGSVSCVTLKAAELCHNLAGIRQSSSSAAGRKGLDTIHYLSSLVAGPGCVLCTI